MFAKTNLASVVTMVLAASALGLSVYNSTQISKLPNESAVDEKIATLSASVSSQLSEKADGFESAVETALQSIVERRRAEAEKAAKAAKAQAAPTDLNADGMLSMNKDGQVVYGNPDAPVTIYSFEDFRCSFCEGYHPILQQYVHASEGQVNWIYKPYPILGPASTQLAIAAECVAQIEGPDAYWRYANQAYATKNWATALKYSELQDSEKISACVQANTFGERIDKSLAEGRELNVTGTPASIFRNNKTEKGALIPGRLQPDQIHQMVQQVLTEDSADD